jgi:LytS/YehU family sensor histidine kinase
VWYTELGVTAGLLDELPSGGTGAGIGVANTRRRLREMYGDAHFFAVTDAPGGGAVATLRLPFRTGAAGTKDEGRASAAPDRRRAG